MRKLFLLGAVLFGVLLAPNVDAASPYCWDKTDRLIVKLKQLDLTTEQLQDVFEFQKQHRDLMAACHEDGRGCSAHEKAEAVFQKKSIGVLDEKQFEKHVGRKRTEAETLRYENHLLKKELAALKAELAAIKLQLASLKAVNGPSSDG